MRRSRADGGGPRQRVARGAAEGEGRERGERCVSVLMAIGAWVEEAMVSTMLPEMLRMPFGSQPVSVLLVYVSQRLGRLMLRAKWESSGPILGSRVQSSTHEGRRSACAVAGSSSSSEPRRSQMTKLPMRLIMSTVNCAKSSADEMSSRTGAMVKPLGRSCTGRITCLMDPRPVAVDTG